MVPPFLIPEKRQRAPKERQIVWHSHHVGFREPSTQSALVEVTHQLLSRQQTSIEDELGRHDHHSSMTIQLNTW